MILSEIKKQNNNFEDQILEIYNLSAQSHVKISFDIPIYTTQVDALGTINLLEAIRQLNLVAVTKIYQASTSELYGDVVETPQNELTPFNPQSPYAIARTIFILNYGKIIDKHTNMFICNGILFNHTSPRRTQNLSLSKNCEVLANIYKGQQQYLILEI